MHFKTLKNKKAVSPIIATLLLILIAVAAGVIIYVWATGYIGTQIGTAGGQETFVITYVKYTGGNTLKVTIVNQGSTAINIKNVAVYNSTYSGNPVAQNTTGGISPSVINPGVTQTLTVTLSGSGNVLTKGTLYVLEVTTVKGNIAVYRFTA